MPPALPASSGVLYAQHRPAPREANACWRARTRPMVKVLVRRQISVPLLVGMGRFGPHPGHSAQMSAPPLTAGRIREPGKPDPSLRPRRGLPWCRAGRRLHPHPRRRRGPPRLLPVPPGRRRRRLGSLLGDLAWYGLGRPAGRRFRAGRLYQRVGPRIEILARRLRGAQLLAARFVYGTKAASMVFWGLHGMPLPRSCWWTRRGVIGSLRLLRAGLCS